MAGYIQKTITKKILNIHVIQSHHFMAHRWGRGGNSGRFYFLGLQNHYGPLLQPQNEKTLAPWKEESLWKTWTVYWKPETQFGTEVCSVKAMIFPVIMCRCEIRTIRKDECQRTELLNCSAWEDSWESFIQQGDQTSQSERKLTSDHCCLSWGIYWGSPGEKNGCFHASSPWQLQANGL